MANSTSEKLNQQNNDIEAIKHFLNVLNDCLYQLTNMGYDTKNLYEIYDLIRNELSSIELLNNNSSNKETIDTINIYAKSLEDLVEQLNKSYDLFNQANKTVQNYDQEHSKVDKPKYKDGNYDVLEEIKKVIVLGLSIIGVVWGVKWTAGAHNWITSTEEIVEYNIDSEGNRTTSYNHSGESTDTIEVYEYLKADENGFRVRNYYTFSKSDRKKEGAELDLLDLTDVKPKSSTIVYDEEINNLNSEYYTTYTIKQVNEGNVAKVDNLSTIVNILAIIPSLIGLIPGLLLILVSNYALEEIDDTHIQEIFIDVYDYLKRLIKYKHTLKTKFNGLPLAEKEKEKYEKIVDLISNQIDKTVNEVSNKLILLEEYRKRQVLNELNDRKIAYEKSKTKELENKKETLKKIRNTLAVLKSDLEKVKDTEDYSKLLHQIPISEGILFKQVDDHLKIRKEFVDDIKFFDLSLIHFDNVECSGIDFSETNASLNIQTVYNKDISYSIFNNRNIPDWSDYEGVNITGSKLQENPLSMINLENAIKSDETMITLKP